VKENLKELIEALLFASPKPLSVSEISRIVEESAELVENTLRKLEGEYRKRGIRIIKVENGYHFVTAEEFSPWIRKIRDIKKIKLSRAALEVLAIVALKQPVTRAEINELRGQNSDAVVKQLVERNLLKIVGKKPGSGGAQLFAVTDNFLKMFNLKSVKDLPSFEELKELALADRPVQQELSIDEIE